MPHEDDPWIERKIITAMVTSTDFLREVRQLYKPRLLGSVTATTLAEWCITHFDTYNAAPGRDIEVIYTAKLRNGLGKSEAEDVEEVLRSLSDEYEPKQFNLPHILDQTRAYFRERNLKNYADDIQSELLIGNVTEAEKLASDYQPLAQQVGNVIDPFADANRVRQAFKAREQPLIWFPKALGDFWNNQLVRDGFVGLMAPEKLGKSYMLMELSMRAMVCGCNVVFFQAGDMTEPQMLLRQCIYMAKRSNEERYCKELYIPVVDCIENQTGTCRRCDRECSTAPFTSGTDFDKLRFGDLVKAYKDNPEHIPCRNCTHSKQTVWFQYRKAVEPLDWRAAWRHLKRWQHRYRSRYRLSTYPNETLTVSEIRTLLDTWERQDNFIPDVIVIDYADLLAPDPDYARLDYRHQQNKTWQRLRRLSQERHCLVITATQAAASSYDVDRPLRLSDFSETKTKYAHVTALYGMNHSEDEKRIGILRLNELVVREGDFDRSSQVKVLQRLQMGKPYLGSFK